MLGMLFMLVMPPMAGAFEGEIGGSGWPGGGIVSPARAA
jgi:hypothetical protein